MKEGYAFEVKDSVGTLRDTRKLPEFAKYILEIEKIFIASVSHVCFPVPPNDEVERRGIALPSSEVALSKSSTSSMAHRRSYAAIVVRRFWAIEDDGEFPDQDKPTVAHCMSRCPESAETRTYCPAWGSGWT
jgi:hypothetical protein